MKDETKEILDNFKIYEERYKKCNENQFIIFYRDIHLLLDYITNLQEVADKRMSIILKIEQYLIDCGVDDEILKLCGIYDVNGVELRKYIEELKGE